MSLCCGVDAGETGDREDAGDGEDGARRRAVLTGLRDRAPRRALVIELLCHELTYGEMAALLYVSPATVKMHLRTIYRQLGVRGAIGAAVAWRSAVPADAEVARVVRERLGDPNDRDTARAEATVARAPTATTATTDRGTRWPR